jgi:hypothetical protein
MDSDSDLLYGLLMLMDTDIKANRNCMRFFCTNTIIQKATKAESREKQLTADAQRVS